MSDPITSAAGAVSPGEIRFYDSIQPPLSAGAYTLSVEQKVTSLKEEKVPTYQAAQPFTVTGPRFQIDAATIHMVFPPADQAGSYSAVLPNIVFKEPSLPWIRGLVPEIPNEKGSPPWMALLTVYDTEIPPAAGKTPPPGSDPKMSTPSTVTVAELVQPSDSRILPPDLPDVVPDSSSLVQVVDMDVGFFRGIAPTGAELPFLAHGRAVDTGGKAMLGMNDSGTFSVVVGNRMARSGADNTVFLVSLEGHAAHLPSGGAIDARYTKIRLVVLGRWSFTAAPSPGGFLELMQQLCADGNGGVGLLRLPAGNDSGNTALQPVQIGYVPLENALRVGETTTSWYRGPLVPAPTTPDNTYGPYHFSDHAIHYDPETGMFNHAYAAAWHIGRLLALSDGDFTRTLFDWRRRYFARVRDSATADMAERKVTSAKPAGRGVKAGFARMLAGNAQALANVLPTVTPRDRHPALAALPGTLSHAEVDALLESGEDPLLALKDKLIRSAAP